jgi:hypothetical protein
MAEKMGPIISTNGLVFCVDAANPQSIVSGQTTWRDLTFNATGGTLTNGVGFSGTGVSSGLLFDGTDDYVNISSDQPFTPRTGLTIESWSNATDITTNRYYEITRRQSLSGGGFPTYLLSYQEYGNVMSFGLKTNVTYNELDIVINSGGTNSWLSYVATWDGTKKRLYRNGSNIGQNEQSGTIDDISGAITAIGRLPTGNSEYFKGRIAYVSNYNRGLSPFEVYQNFNALKGRYGIPDIVTGGLVLNLDAGNPYSYSPDNTGSTVWTDVTYNTTGGTLLNGTSYTGGTMVFDGTNDYVTCNAPNVLNLVNDLTLSCWVKPTGGSGAYRVILNKNYTNNNPTYEMGISNGNKLYWYGNGIDKYGTTNIQLNTIYHFTITINSSAKTGVLYINGSFETSISGLATQIANSGPLNIGVDAPTGTSEGGFFNGNIYNVQIYNRALSATEVQQNFNALRGRYGI